MSATADSFPDHLAKTGREEMIAAIETAPAMRRSRARRRRIPSTAPSKPATKRRSAPSCSSKHRDEIDGIIVTLPNFGDERAIADTLRLAGPERAGAGPGDARHPEQDDHRDRRDSFCGKMSACNNLTQYGIPYSLTTLHTEAPDSDDFRKDLDGSPAVCRVVSGLRRLRIGAIGARPAAFNTVRYSEKILEAQRHLHRAHRSLRNPRPHRPHEGRRSGRAGESSPPSTTTSPPTAFPHEALMKMAKLGAVIDGWMKRDRRRHQRRAVLDLARRILRRGALHRHEHDERRT